STYISGEYQPSYLGRGATPKGQSYTIKRISVDVASAKASDNQDDIFKSYDDNELSDWEAEDGSVTYTLARQAKIAEIDIKSSARRIETNTYAVEIDGKEVWRGKFNRHYGSINNIKFEPTVGSEVTFKLVECDPTVPRIPTRKVFELAGTNVADFPDASPTDKTNPNNVRGFGNLGVTNGTPAKITANTPVQPVNMPKLNILSITEIEFYELPE
ncbi:MAG: hypothetical protein IKM58_03260, partial [Tidjanibacter sp.]|nr:hypothetical protein [Tidjanibacter sp.]